MAWFDKNGRNYRYIEVFRLYMGLTLFEMFREVTIILLSISISRLQSVLFKHGFLSMDGSDKFHCRLPFTIGGE